MLVNAGDLAKLLSGDVEAEDGIDPSVEAAVLPVDDEAADTDMMDVPFEAIGASSGLQVRIVPIIAVLG